MPSPLRYAWVARYTTKKKAAPWQEGRSRRGCATTGL